MVQMLKIGNCPDRMKSRPFDARGFRIPYSQYVDPKTGVPDFRVADHESVLRCLRNRWCGLCGKSLGAHVHFIGGPLCVKNAYFFDPGMHKDCAEYAMQVCPHLSRAKGRYNEAASYPEIEGLHVAIEDAVSPNKVETFAIMHGKQFSYGYPAPGQPVLIKAKMPWVDVTWWRNGKQVEAPE